MKISIGMDDFPMAFFDSFKQDIKSQKINATIQVGGEDTVFITAVVDDVVKAQILTIICDRYHFKHSKFKSLFGDKKGGDDYEKERS